MIWTIFLILAVLKVMELITTSWLIIFFFGLAGFSIAFLRIIIKMFVNTRIK